MAKTMSIPCQAEMTLKISDMTLVNDIKRLLKHVNGIASISVRKTKNELDLALEDIKKGNLKSFDNVDDFMDYLNS